MLSIADVFDYLKPEQSSTKVAFIISAREWGVEFLEDKSAMKNFIETSEELPKGTAEKGIIGKCVDLSRLASAEGTNRLLDELVLFAQANRIMLTRIGSKA